MAVKHSLDDWKDYAFTSPNVCSTIKSLMENKFSNFTDNLGIRSKDFPIPPVYLILSFCFTKITRFGKTKLLSGSLRHERI